MGEAAETQLDAEVLARAAEAVGESCSSDLSALLGKTIELRPAGVEQIGADAVAERDQPLVHQLCRTAGQPALNAHFLMPRAEAGTLAALQQGADCEEARGEELDAERRAAFQVAMKLVATAFGSSVEALTSLETKDAREILEPASDPTWLGGERFLRVRFDVAIDGFPDGRLDVLLPDGGGAEGAMAPGTTIWFLADREGEQGSLEELVDVLGWPVSVLGPEQLCGEWTTGMVDAGAVIVPWAIGGRSGIELVERLLGDPTLSGVPVIMSSERPTRARVAAALRAGARSFVLRPYDGQELRRRILEARGERAASPPKADPVPAEAT